MRMRKTVTLVALATLLGGCGGGGGGGGGSASSGNGSESLIGVVQLLANSPSDGAVEVPVDGSISCEFDAAIARDSLGDPDTWLRVAGTTTNLPGTFELQLGGRRVVFTPAAPLAAETDYEFQLSGMTCDNDGRLLDRDLTIAFRTVDPTAPTLLSVDVAEGSTSHSRTGSFTFTFSEAMDLASIDATTLHLVDGYSFVYAGSRTTSGNTVVFTPFADLPGERSFTLTITGDVTDRAGNRLGTGTSVHFETTTDAVAPTVASMWPAQGATGISPLVQPGYVFSESMDPNTVEPSSLIFQDEFGSIVPFAIHASADQHTLRVAPLQPLETNRTYTLAFLLGGAAATDVSGNGLVGTDALVFRTGTDTTAPTVSSTTPGQGETRVSGNVIVSVVCSEALDPAFVDIGTVHMTAAGGEVPIVVELSSPTTVRITPVLQLPTDADCVVTLAGGHEGLHDVAGNPLADDHVLTFTTSSSSTMPRAMLLPADSATGVPRGAHASIVFDTAMDPTTVDSTTVQLCTDAGVPLSGTLTFGSGNRVATVTPDEPLSSVTYYRVRVRGGSSGVRAANGNWFATDQQTRFRTGTGFDLTPPLVHVTVNSIDDTRNAHLVVPQSGFTVDVSVSDPGDQSIDMGSTEVLFEGAGTGPGAGSLFAAATVGYSTMTVRVPTGLALSPGAWTLTVRAHDLSGNVGVSTPMALGVAEATAQLLPFGRTQVVWVRSDLDRDDNGTADFDDDLLRLGFTTAGDPLGTNARMRDLLLDGILAQANHLYGRGSRGEPLDSGSVGLRFTKRRPTVEHTQMALGGFDPEGSSHRIYGDDSTGVLGRAYYDYRNSNMAERNTSSSPGLGVFPAEMWLYQTLIHIQVWPSYQTVFAQRFRPLCPDMGGTPAGANPLDAVVLDPAFDYATATSQQRARWLVVMQAADDWAAVIGIVLAHEVGHSVGLVAPGNAPRGLFGDNTLHDSYAGAAEVMAPSVGYEAMTSLDYQFRDIDLAYLRQRILLR